MPRPARHGATRVAAALLRRHREIARELLPAGAARRALHATDRRGGA